ncbi:MAG: phenylalanine--tRNA ligase subunit beta [Candidatus Omnitrophica bacterium]|nr:phenylalanine--tRNA ligase subunit beta [Candidatus Omnitrophota bacterium]
MKLSYNWIKDYLDLAATPDELARALTMSGSEVGCVEDKDGDKIMELEITSNRPDCLNIIGLAREASAVFDIDLKLPDFAIPKKVPSFAKASEGRHGPLSIVHSPISCLIQDPNLCPYYTARVISGVKVLPGSGKVKKLIEALGMRSVNNIVDITNFCLMELGQPLHAFDLDKIEGGKIIVRVAKEGEKIVTIDGVERELHEGMLVIADAQKPVAIAGVMGGLGTEVTDATKNILLESAYFNPLSVRRTARKLAISTDSSYRFERGVDKGMIVNSSNRAATMMTAGGGGIGALIECGELKVKPVEINVGVGAMARILGVPLEVGSVKKVFTRLGMTVCASKADQLTVRVPGFREDIKTATDLGEEALRIYGYEKVPATMPDIFPSTVRKGHSRLVKERLTELLVSSGLSEIITYSLIKEAASDRFSGITGNKVSLMNPLSEDQKFLTPHLLDGMLKAVSFNLNRKTKDLGLFEIGKIYSERPDGSYDEIDTLCLAFTGSRPANVAEGAREFGFYDLKGVIENVLSRVRVEIDLAGKDMDFLSGGAEISLRGKGPAGFIGEVTKNILSQYDIEQKVFILQIRLQDIYRTAAIKSVHNPIPRFPFSERDISILCPAGTEYGSVRASIMDLADDLVRSVDFLDVYSGDNIPKGMKSVTISIQYGLSSRTLEADEIEKAHLKVKSALSSRLGVSFR